MDSNDRFWQYARDRKSMQNEKNSIDNEIGDLLYQSTEEETQMDISIRWNRNVSTI